MCNTLSFELRWPTEDERPFQHVSVFLTEVLTWDVLCPVAIWFRQAGLALFDMLQVPVYARLVAQLLFETSVGSSSIDALIPATGICILTLQTVAIEFHHVGLTIFQLSEAVGSALLYNSSCSIQYFIHELTLRRDGNPKSWDYSPLWQQSYSFVALLLK
jgi:hypothetical protein